MRLLPCLLLTASISVAACSSTGSGTHICAVEGAACTGGCCLGLQCVSGVCASSTDLGGAGTGDLAMGGAAPDLACTANGGRCGSSSECCSPNTCGASKTCTPPDTRAGFGQKCTDNSGCLSGICLVFPGAPGGVCTDTCTRSSECAAKQANPVYTCMQGPSAKVCAPTCGASADCTTWDPTWTCAPIPNVDNILSDVCGYFTGGTDGTACLDNAQCLSNACNGYWCTEHCTTDAKCGADATCVFTSGNTYDCFPTCTTNQECATSYGAAFKCVSVTTHDKKNAMVCAM